MSNNGSVNDHMNTEDVDNDSLEDIEFPTTTVVITSQIEDRPKLKTWDDDAVLTCFDLSCSRALGKNQGREQIWVPRKDVTLTSKCAAFYNDKVKESEEIQDEMRRKKTKSSDEERKQVPLFVAAIDPIYAAIELANRRKSSND